MVLTVTEDTPADMLAGSMELLVQMPQEQRVRSQRLTVPRSTPMMDLLVQIATAHKLAAASYSLQAIGERGRVLAHQPNTPVGALDALQLRLLPKQPPAQQPRRARAAGQPFEATFRLQVHLPRNQLYVARLSSRTVLAEILEQVCREKNLDRGKYELRHPANLSQRLDPSLTLHDYQLQEVTLCPRQQGPGAPMGSALSSQDIMALQKQEDCRRQQARHSLFGLIFGRPKEGPRPSRPRSAAGPDDEAPPRPAPAPALPARPHRKRRPAPKPPAQARPEPPAGEEQQPRPGAAEWDKLVVSHSRNSSDSSGYHEASVLSDNPDSGALQPRMPETLPRRSRAQAALEGAPRGLSQTAQASKSLGNLALASARQRPRRQPSPSHGLGRGLSNSSLNSAGQRKKRAAPPPPSTATAQGLERIAASDIDQAKPSSDVDVGPGPTQVAAAARQPSVESARVVEPGKSAPMDTDLLLQKVSDTLSHSLSPPSPPPTPESPASAEAAAGRESSTPAETADHASSEPAESASASNERLVTSVDDAEGNDSNSSSNSDARLGSATSDYVSSTGEELSIADWECQQIPAPPSAFRDDDQPAEGSSAEPADQPPPAEPRDHPPAADVADTRRPVATQLSREEDDDLKKAQVISELETKIRNSSKPLAEPEPSKVDELDASPRIAPTENYLSNFTITTYSRKKSLDIFEPVDEQNRLHSETRILTTFATLTRGKSLASEFAENNSHSKSSALKSAQSMDRVATISPLRSRDNFAAERKDVFREKPVHRSKSYIALSSNDKFQSRSTEADQSRDETDQRESDQSSGLNRSTAIKKFTSTTNLTSSSKDEEVLSHKQKFSQWRDNILERHKEPSRETQLQSLQVLKSILPQLQKSQKPDNKSYASADDVSTTKEPVQSRFDERDTYKPSPSEFQLRSKGLRTHEPAKRYTYCGPPAVSLGSWSERPSLNVQIKTDTDYKLGGKNSSSGARTVVNLSRRDIDGIEAATETANEQAPKKTEKEKDGESCVDTSSVNFRELTKAFGQPEVRLRPKSLAAAGRNTQQRHSEYLERSKASETVPVKSNALAQSHVGTSFANFLNQYSNNPPVPPVKRYTSVVGIINNNNNNNNNTNISNNNVSGMSNNTSKALLQKPVGATRDKESVVPKPPTMPIITGVTLKSVNSRPKSGPSTIQADPRDLLLESIRNFGRHKLKSVS
ncbi:nucleolar protein dao-5 isoform X2 [Phymastichus coffea]|uniref:nucleolar protein dao-5 isoform X2 n=1 Tax=Phymastichus coffea TaxID=108790 RepID=UPI00273B28EA|nr:nucleolar protein dao-5 isoform X2 [Phymastichus coffea]